MPKGFWKELKKPFYCLAPMAGVTNSVFRQVIQKISLPTKPVFYTEFVSVEGLCSVGREKLINDLKFSKEERPIIAQFFGSSPEKFNICAKLALDLGFDGIDINMGCPDKAVVAQGAGSALILKQELAKEIIIATKEGGGDLPVSVKTRIGFDQNQAEDWISFLLKQDLDSIAIHGRTKKQGYTGEVDWEAIKTAVDLASEIKPEKRPLIIGNGEIKNIIQANENINLFGVDGIMIGQGILGNPWLFSGRLVEDISENERIKTLLLHFKLSEEYSFAESFNELKKYFKAYLSGFLGAKELRINLMGAKTIDEARDILKIKI